MTSPNPYAPPHAPMDPGARDALAAGECPQCHRHDVHRPTFTWWGGALGPRLLNHTVCRDCGFGFNFKTGKSNGTAITIYVTVSFVVAFLLIALFAAAR